MWDSDKGVSDQVADLVTALGHDRLYVRFHADPHPPGYARKIGGPEQWGRLCAQRMEQYYGPLQRAGVQLHAILANETDADYEGGLSVVEASSFYRRAIGEYAAKRPDDIIHVPAPTGAPATHRAHLEQYEQDGWVRSNYWIDGHGYDGDLENVLNVLTEIFPGHQYTITETNDLADFGWPAELIRQGRVRDVIYFILNWARGGEGRVHPPSPDDRAKQMSLLRFPSRYQQFMALPLVGTPAPEPDPIPEPTPEPEPEPMPELPRGIDVASYQGNPDWAAVAASGIAFAFTKATEGTGYTNPTFRRNWSEIKAHGLYRGAYHYARPETWHGIDGARSEAEYFVATATRDGELETGDMLVLDLEPTTPVPGLGTWALAWLERVEQLTGVLPLIYTGPWVIAQQGLSGVQALGRYGLWLAAYQEQMPPAPQPWPVVAFWQFTSSGRIPGIAGDVDVNVFNGDADRIPLYGKPGAAQPSPPIPSGYSVGEGILTAMTAHGDVPATDEVFSQGFSEAFAQSGARYVWVGSLGRVLRYDPAA
jgi:lysozyme